MQHQDRLWYRRMFKIPKAWHGKQILLHFGAVDYESEVFVDGKHAGRHTGGYDAIHFDITGLVSDGDEHELVVRVFDPTEKGGQPRGKQNTQPRGTTYTPTTGIWQTVWLEPVSRAFIEDLTIVPDIDNHLIKLTVVSSQAQNGTVEVSVRQEALRWLTCLYLSAKKAWSPFPTRSFGRPRVHSSMTLASLSRTAATMPTR